MSDQLTHCHPPSRRSVAAEPTCAKSPETRADRPSPATTAEPLNVLQVVAPPPPNVDGDASSAAGRLTTKTARCGPGEAGSIMTSIVTRSPRISASKIVAIRTLGWLQIKPAPPVSAGLAVAIVITPSKAPVRFSRSVKRRLSGWGDPLRGLSVPLEVVAGIVGGDPAVPWQAIEATAARTMTAERADRIDAVPDMAERNGIRFADRLRGNSMQAYFKTVRGVLMRCPRCVSLPSHPRHVLWVAAVMGTDRCV